MRKIDYSLINRHRGLSMTDLQHSYLRQANEPLKEDLEIYDRDETRHPEWCDCPHCEYDWRMDDYHGSKVAHVRKQIMPYLDLSGRFSLGSILPESLKSALGAVKNKQVAPQAPLKKDRIYPWYLAPAIVEYVAHFEVRSREKTPIPAGLQVYLDEPENQDRFAELLDGPLLGLENYLIDVLLLQPFWVRDLQDWSGDDLGDDDIWRSLVDHLFVIYPVPSFLYNHWRESHIDPTETWVKWFLLAAQGASLFEAAPAFGWKLPPRFPHYLAQVPAHLSFEKACLYAEILRLELKHLRYEWVCNSRSLYLNPTDPHISAGELEFARGMLRWIDLHGQAFAHWNLEQILDLGRHVYTEGERWGWPEFSFVGRGTATIVQALQDYSRGRHKRGRLLTWKSQGWDWEYAQAAGHVWTMQELCSGNALQEESKVMHHCVESYAAYCAKGMSAIFSLKYNGLPTLTVEYSIYSRRIVQAKGPYNCNANKIEETVLARWITFVNQKKQEAATLQNQQAA